MSGAANLEGEDGDGVVGFAIRVHDHEPAPRAEEEAQFWRRRVERWAEERKALERRERAPDTVPRVGGKAVRVDQLGERSRRCFGHDQPRHVDA